MIELGYIRKKDKFDKERVPVWSQNVYTVDKIEHQNDQDFYKVEGIERPFLRNEILKLNG